MKFILGKKIEMTQVWNGDKVMAVTKVQVGPCTVVQVKDEKKDGYKAVQIGYLTKKEKNIKKPQIGHFKGLDNFRYLKEFRVNEESSLKRGDKFGVDSFETGEKIEVTGVSKGKGFQGVVKRHGFAGQIKTHGTKDQVRMPGSIGATGPAHVFKGMRMGGRMGGDQVTFKNGEIVDIDLENSFLYVKGGVPGARNSLVLIKAQGDLKLLEDIQTKPEEEKSEEEKPEAKEPVEKIEEAGEEKTEDKKEEKKTEENKEEKETDKK